MWLDADVVRVLFLAAIGGTLLLLGLFVDLMASEIANWLEQERQKRAFNRRLDDLRRR